jgi:hypothetical protein
MTSQKNLLAGIRAVALYRLNDSILFEGAIEANSAAGSGASYSQIDRD